MANTPYIDLVKPAGTDKALISVINANSDKIDSAVGGVQDALAIVCNGNTHGAITSGQYVYVRAHETLQEGLYKANSNIAANAALNSTNLTADSSGGLNSLNEQIATLNGNTNVKYAVNIGTNLRAERIGRVVTIYTTGRATLEQIPAGYRPSTTIFFLIQDENAIVKYNALYASGNFDDMNSKCIFSISFITNDNFPT